MMRGPAHLAGLGELHAFLERGFEAFRSMRDASEFLEAIVDRERAVAAALPVEARGRTARGIAVIGSEPEVFFLSRRRSATGWE